MKGSKLLGIGALVFIVLLGYALLWDAGSAVQAAHARIEEIDREVRKQEGRFIKTVSSLPGESAEFAAVLREYQSAKEAPARREVFSRVEAEGQRRLLAVNDPTNPVQRRLGDEAAGAINRREVALKSLSEALKEYNDQASSGRGSLAARFYGLPPSIDN